MTISDSQIKAKAFIAEKKRAFKGIEPQDILAYCSDGVWERTLWKNPDGKFGWGKWERIRFHM
jgi:hypothetical protein